MVVSTSYISSWAFLYTHHPTHHQLCSYRIPSFLSQNFTCGHVRYHKSINFLQFLTTKYLWKVSYSPSKKHECTSPAKESQPLVGHAHNEYLCVYFNCGKYLAHEMFERDLGIWVAGNHCFNCWVHLTHKVGWLRVKLGEIYLLITPINDVRLIDWLIVYY